MSCANVGHFHIPHYKLSKIAFLSVFVFVNIKCTYPDNRRRIFQIIKNGIQFLHWRSHVLYFFKTGKDVCFFSYFITSILMNMYKLMFTRFLWFFISCLKFKQMFYKVLLLSPPSLLPRLYSSSSSSSWNLSTHYLYYEGVWDCFF